MKSFAVVAAALATLSSHVSAATCSSTVLSALLTNQYIEQCSSDSGYVFTAATIPSQETIELMCASSACRSLLADAQALDLTECTLPVGDNINLLADLVDYVPPRCPSASGSAATGSSTSTTTSVGSTSTDTTAGSTSTGTTVGSTTSSGSNSESVTAPADSTSSTAHSRLCGDRRTAHIDKQEMRKATLAKIIHNWLPLDTNWPDDPNVRFEGGRTVLMVVSTVPPPQLAVKLIDFVCHQHTIDFWARDTHRRHVIMDACHSGVHPSVLRRLVKWARKTRLKVIVPMSRRDSGGRDAMQLAIQGGHGVLASCLLGGTDPIAYVDILCKHWPLEVLELAIESGNEQCVRDLLVNKRVVHDLQPGVAARLNSNMRWEQRHIPAKRLFNVFTCVGAAVRCDLPQMVSAIYKINPKETRQAACCVLSCFFGTGNI
ncbi:hypothetical protein BBO99_00006906 [Phytophthora kernoviae]|uniref:Elicitin n=1 Tax=Phytophthora kernoviae TaxID=325452 RepID=A0A3R7GW82_9STRA|nr:hypothetical protein JM18_006262 [Phytophthora kernoviae]RLN44092.1 hypothetical protein BBI17_007006 [Phytophthora kernoviae]RLN77236.1 hypothetical protein BBO99_00006906 [Phytophthora kernoviae]